MGLGKLIKKKLGDIKTDIVVNMRTQKIKNQALKQAYQKAYDIEMFKSTKAKAKKAAKERANRPTIGQRIAENLSKPLKKKSVSKPNPWDVLGSDQSSQDKKKKKDPFDILG